MSKKINRNDLCPCGSKKKYKQCCLNKAEQTARYTSEGKFKFSAKVISATSTSSVGENCSRLFQRLTENLAHEQKNTTGATYAITKNKEITSKKLLNKAKAKQDRIVTEKLKHHDFQILPSANQECIPQYAETEKIQDTSFVPEKFIPTQQDFRIQENHPTSSEEEN
ncbi:YecA family protein [Candidatus Chlamydia sanziniae]|uniref:Protein export cytoplasm protein SecA ATPase RNA helicase n=1 Tax=Candidatus Chlamydia sanziniae TaxID=1806891 RepID=A0A1A9HWD4_9CHLA|nr:SEC-C metal-binding domain-containing protein [Candidatus Chlamydia sanziniae]ANH79007.1 Protein export cytoplasm protein SecA ATPase RNA helicase [Candidatus Chlamydia sanziniae]